MGRWRRSTLGRRTRALSQAVTGWSDARLIERSGYFDARWYLAQNPDVLAAGGSPARHYLHHGHAEHRDPGPLFDGNWYLAQHPDVARSGRNPLVEFLRADPARGRRARSLPVPAPAGRENLLVQQPAHPSPPGTVAVMVHAYYPDTFEDVGRALRSIPFPFTLLVSTPTEAARAAVLTAIRRHRLPAAADVRVTPNRGRNFGPFVAEFAGAIAAHDYLLHLHTKRSLFTGSDQGHWRDQLLASLVGSPAVVSAALQLLSTGPGAGGPGAGEPAAPIGLFMPTTAATMPYWAHHWLSNAALAPGLFGLLGVSRYPTGGYFEYPVGGMFWARVDAIRPLLAAGFTYDDFPEEDGQTDGTLAHAIERCFVPLVQSQGYGFVAFDRDTGAFQHDWGTRNLDQYRRRSVGDLHQAIDEAEVVSFDVFDTVLTRRSVRPDPIIRLADLRLADTPTGDHDTPTDFFTARRRAEEAVRLARHWTGDVSLPEIYEELARTGPWDRTVLDATMAAELADDLAAMVPRAAVVDAVTYARSAGKRVVAVSDTYFERPHVERLLRAAGVLECFDELYLSSEQRARKDRGDLWDLVLQREGVPPEQWLHVGDNERSDVQAAEERGLRTLHCMNPTTLLGLRGFHGLASADPARWGTDLLLGPTAATLANDPFLAGRDFEPLAVERPEQLGYTVFGPVAMAFLAWMAQHPALAEVEHLYFLSREGYLLQQLWERLRAGGRPDLPASTYLLVSRRSTMAAAQALAFNPDQILRGFGFDGSVQDLLLGRLGLALPTDHPFADLHVTLPDDDVAAGKVLEDLEEVIVGHGAGELPHMAAYLRHSGVASGRAAVVDIGYSGTIQRHLQALIGRGLTGFYMGTLAGARAVQDAGGTAYGCFAEDVPKWTLASPFHRYSILLEALLTAPQGQVEWVEMVDGRPAPHFRQEYRSREELEVVEQLQQGATRYVEDLLASYGPAVLDAPIDPAAVLDLATMVATGAIVCPTATDRLVVDDDFCGFDRLVLMATGRIADPEGVQ